MHDQHLYYIIYYFIGLSYWAVNIFVRKLHTKNDPDDGWFLAPMWMIMWPLFFLLLAISAITKIKNKRV